MNEFVPLNCAVVTVSDTRTKETDTSGKYLCEQLAATGHRVGSYQIIPDDRGALKDVFSSLADDEDCHIIISTGGTGLRPRDITTEVASEVIDTPIPGFGEYFRYVSISDIGSSTIQSRAIAGLVGRTLLVCLPGSTGACRTAWEHILVEQLDSRNRPCNFVEVVLGANL